MSDSRRHHVTTTKCTDRTVVPKAWTRNRNAPEAAQKPAALDCMATSIWAATGPLRECAAGTALGLRLHDVLAVLHWQLSECAYTGQHGT